MTNKLLLENGLGNTRDIVEKFQRDTKCKIISAELALSCFKQWVRSKIKIKPIQPYLLNSMSYWFSKIILEGKYLIDNKSIFKSNLKKEVNKIAKKLFTKKLHTTKRAKLFPLSQVDEIAKYLWKGNLMSKASAIALRITFLSGCRCGDLSLVFWEDILVTNNEYGLFLSLPMRASKTNPRCLKKEFITMKIDEDSDSNWNILTLLMEYKNVLVENKKLTKTIFPTKPTKNYSYYFDKGRKKLGFSNKITGHSGRNSTIKRMLLANVNSEDICIQLHWKRDSQMIFRYRDTLMETTNVGAPFKLYEFDKNKKHNKTI